jgi:hypothetical protein
MGQSNDRRSPRVRTRRRGGWVFLFLVASVVGLVGAFVTSLVLPWVLISGAILGVSGYQIWRIDHPGESARYELGWRAKSVLAATAWMVALLAFEVAWVWVVAAFIAFAVIFLVVFALANRDPVPAAAITAAASIVPHDDSPPEG